MSERTKLIVILWLAALALFVDAVLVSRRISDIGLVVLMGLIGVATWYSVPAPREGPARPEERARVRPALRRDAGEDERDRTENWR